jgi:hypothetical protein
MAGTAVTRAAPRASAATERLPGLHDLTRSVSTASCSARTYARARASVACLTAPDAQLRDGYMPALLAKLRIECSTHFRARPPTRARDRTSGRGSRAELVPRLGSTLVPEDVVRHYEVVHPRILRGFGVTETFRQIPQLLEVDVVDRFEEEQGEHIARNSEWSTFPRTMSAALSRKASNSACVSRLRGPSKIVVLRRAINPACLQTPSKIRLDGKARLRAHRSNPSSRHRPRSRSGA